MSNKDGGSAFPEVFTDEKWPSGSGSQPYGDTYSSGGMTLRDYFTAKVMIIYMAAYPRDTAAELSYLDADAMLKAREATK